MNKEKYVKTRCSIAYKWIKKHPNLSKKEGNKKLNKYMKTHCFEDRSCFLCPFLEFEGVKNER